MPAILLLGPTGAGKSPLGDYLEQHGLWARPCIHFDFGAELRSVAAVQPGFLHESELDVVNRVLTEGALLENEHFEIARKILGAFLGNRNAADNLLVCMNGLPRHTGQARDLADIVAIGTVIYLACTPRVVYERIREDSGGDRAGRKDDSAAEVTAKLQVFEQRTAPLLDHYRAKGVTILKVQVCVRTTPAEIVKAIEDKGPEKHDNH